MCDNDTVLVRVNNGANMEQQDATASQTSSRGMFTEFVEEVYARIGTISQKVKQRRTVVFPLPKGLTQVEDCLCQTNAFSFHMPVLYLRRGGDPGEPVRCGGCGRPVSLG